MNSIFKKQLLLGLMLVFAPAIIGLETAIISEEDELPDVPWGIYRKITDPEEIYEEFEATGNCNACDLQNRDLRGVLNELRNEGKRVEFYNANLTGANLSGVELYKPNLKWTNFTNADLSGVTLIRPSLYRVNFTNANLSEATFFGGAPERGEFSGANLSGATFSGVDLTGVDFTGSTGTNVKFFGSKVDKDKLSAEILETAEFYDERLPAQEEEEYASFVTTGVCSGCNLQNRDLREVLNRLSDEGKHVTFYDSNLAGANLAGVNLPGRFFNDDRFVETNLTGAHLSGANLSGQFLDELDFTDADLSGVNFSKSRMIRVTLTGANLMGADFSGVTFVRVDLTGVDFTGVDVTDVDFSDATGTDISFDNSRVDKLKLPLEILKTANFDGKMLSSDEIGEILLKKEKRKFMRFSKESASFWNKAE